MNRCPPLQLSRRTSPASAAKFTQAVVLLPAEEEGGTYGGQMCSDIYSIMTTAAGSPI